jgi:hypothetical protein
MEVLEDHPYLGTYLGTFPILQGEQFAFVLFVAHALIVDEDLPVVQLFQMDDAPQQGALSATRGPDKAEYLSWIYIEAYPTKYRTLSVLFADANYFEQWLGHQRDSPSTFVCC